MSFFCNRKNICAINFIRRRWGLTRNSQSNAGGNMAVVRLYDKPEDKGKPKLALEELTTEKELLAKAESMGLDKTSLDKAIKKSLGLI